MRVLTLRHKGHSLKVAFKAGFYYTKTEFEPGKTLYQILFEHLIDGKTVSQRSLVRQYKNINPFIREGVIRYLLKKIEAAAKGSKNSKLRKMRFKRMPRGGASPVISRKNPNSRFTVNQRQVLERTIKKLYTRGKTPKYEQIRLACLQALQEKGLAKNIALSDLTIWRAKKRLGLPIRKSKSTRHPRRRR